MSFYIVLLLTNRYSLVKENLLSRFYLTDFYLFSYNSAINIWFVILGYFFNLSTSEEMNCFWQRVFCQKLIVFIQVEFY